MKPSGIINESKRVAVNYFSLLTLLFALLSVGCVKVDSYETDRIPSSGNTAEIPDWSDPNDGAISVEQAYSIGDYYPDPNVQFVDGRVIGIAPIGIVFWLDNPVKGKSAHGKIVSIREQAPGSGVKWYNGGQVYCGAISDIDGQANTNAIDAYILSHSSIEQFPAFHSCVSQGTRWYLPAKKELRAIYAGMSDRQWVDRVATDPSEIQDWGDSARSLEDGISASARNAFNANLSRAGGETISISTWYWSSTENSNDTSKVSCLDFGSGYESHILTKNSPRRVRAISAF